MFRDRIEVIEFIANAVVSGIAIVMLGTLETVAILKGVDGAYFGLVIAGISGIAGYNFKNLKEFLRERRLF